MNKNINTIIIDDEIGAFENITALITDYFPNISILGHAQNTAEAEKLIIQYRPDLVLLDIEMPNETGIDFIKRLWPIDFEIAFVTAYDEYAIKTFRLNALDYILKPINIDYFKESLNRIYTQILDKKTASTAQPIGLHRFITEQKEDHIVLRDGKTLESIHFDEIQFIEANGAYSIFNIARGDQIKTIVVSNNLAYYQGLLPEHFIRCHRSYLINAHEIINLQKSDENNYSIVMTKNVIIPVSRRRVAAIKHTLL